MSILFRILPNSNKDEYFLTIGFDEYRICAAVGKISANTITIIGTGETEFREGEQETEAADMAISTAEKNISADVLIEKAIFGIPVSLLVGEKIKEKHLTRIKKISKELSLKTQGFIEYPAALAYYLETKEESPPTMLLISIGRTTITLSLIHVGKVEKNIIVEKTGSITTDFQNALSQYASEIMPSRIMLFDETKNASIEEYHEELLRFSWQKNTSFLHVPKIEILPSSILLTALVETVGGTLIKELHMEDQIQPSSADQVQSSESLNTIPNNAEKQQTDILAVAQKAHKKNGEEPQSSNNMIPSEKPVPVDQSDLFGFEEENEIIKKPTYNKSSESTEKPLFSQAQEKVNILIKVKELLPHLSIPFPNFSLSVLPILTILIILVALVSGVVFFFWYYPRATLNLIVYPLASSTQIDITLSSNPSQIASGKNIIASQSISEEVKGDKTAITTGKIQVGEPAKGSVTLYNKTLSAKSFPKSTTLLTGNLRFLLDDEISVASASDTGEGLTFGKISTKVTAAVIGPDGNIESGKTFTIKDFPESSYYAKNTDKFSGGTSRDVSSVSKEDQETLQTALTDELGVRAKQLLIQKIPEGYTLLENSVEKTIISKKFNSAVGVEAKELSLSMNLSVTASIFRQSDLINLTNTQSVNPPSGYVAEKTRTSIRFQEVKVDKKGDVNAKAIITAYFLPVIDEKEIESEIAGKSYQNIEVILRKNNLIGGFSIVPENTFLFSQNHLPSNKSNIVIQTIPY